MYLKKLDIFGFKSFADKTTLNFGSGITAVIGPNGCGKSNVFDAIRWVLGEQSVKELRGSSMEDVIFNGTDKKAPLGFAEVSLTFSNDTRTLPVDYNEVVITRRLFRSGESEYLINKSQVRLKDITEMFMGTGVGAEAYSMIQQGKVDMVVSAKPEDRRIILDEAAGVTKYKAKRREALNKLKATENNLLRINDIVTEIKRQIATCERQAKKARRYKEEFEKLKVLEVRSARCELSNISNNREQLSTLLDEMKQKENELQQELQEFTNLIEHQTTLLEELEDKINQVHGDEIKLDSQIDINSRQIGFNEERIGNIDQTEQRVHDTLAQLEERCRQQREKIGEVGLYLSTLDGEVQKDMQSLQEKKDRLLGIAGSIDQGRNDIKATEEKILNITSEQVGVKNKLTESMKQVQSCLARQRRLEHEQQKVLVEKEQIDLKFSDMCGNIDRVGGVVDELRGDLGRRREVLVTREKEAEELASMIEGLERKSISLHSQKEFIEKLTAQYDDIPDPVAEGRLIVNTPPMDHHTGIIGKVREVKEVSSGYIDALKQSFGNEGQKLYEIICETKFIELDPMQISLRIEELGEQIRVKILDKDSVVHQIDELRAGIQDVEFQLQERETELSILQAQKDDVVQEVNKLQDELELVKVELDEVVTSLAAYHQAESSLTHQLEVLNQQMHECQMRIKDIQEELQSKTLEREDVTVSIAQLETELHSVEDKKTSHAENLKLFQETLDTSLSEISRLELEKVEIQEKKVEYHKDIEHIKDGIIRLKEEKQSLQGVLTQYRVEKDELTQRVNSLRANVTSYINDIEEIRNTVHSKQMNEQQIEFKEKEIKDRLIQSYKIDLDTVTDDQLDDSGLKKEISSREAMPPEEMRIMIVRLRKRCDSFGSVNLVAIEEFEELKERFEFLTKQQSDLLTAKESLHSTIRKINRETRQMFLNTFTRVSEEFRIYFRMLFGGGEAQLVLLDPENVLESGIDIIARPPGKKCQNISLLSGGEKTLTAIALIFGVFKVNPSPFCILDEIDAALDESNVGRYSYLLKDFSKIAQFIVITHNKKTIESANVLYGITMQETGVSKVVSVKFSDKDKPEIDSKDGGRIAESLAA